MTLPRYRPTVGDREAMQPPARSRPHVSIKSCRRVFPPQFHVSEQGLERIALDALVQPELLNDDLIIPLTAGLIERPGLVQERRRSPQLAVGLQSLVGPFLGGLVDTPQEPA